MSIDLSQFHQVFLEESFEGLDLMEGALMELDPDNMDDETINAIFRAASVQLLNLLTFWKLYWIKCEAVSAIFLPLKSICFYSL